jgi:2-methylcitrate dehydratase PrpD
VAIIDGKAGEEEYSDSRVHDPEVVTLRDKVGATASENIAEDECHVTVTLKDGRVLKKHVEHAIGSLARPMTDADLDAKFGSLADPILGAQEAGRLRDLCWNIEKLDDVAVLAAAAVPAI